MVTTAPDDAGLGAKFVIVGAGTQVNPDFVPVPCDVVTTTLPDAPAPTTAVIDVGETTLNEVAAAPPNVTLVAPVKLVPVIVTETVLPAPDGVNELIAGMSFRNTESFWLPA